MGGRGVTTWHRMRLRFDVCGIFTHMHDSAELGRHLVTEWLKVGPGLPSLISESGQLEREITYHSRVAFIFAICIYLRGRF